MQTSQTHRRNRKAAKRRAQPSVFVHEVLACFLDLGSGGEVIRTGWLPADWGSGVPVSELCSRTNYISMQSVALQAWNARWEAALPEMSAFDALASAACLLDWCDRELMHV